MRGWHLHQTVTLAFKKHSEINKYPDMNKHPVERRGVLLVWVGSASHRGAVHASV